ncbi:hypothetical protein [uncultured Roseivirga sp.]|uniref:hypothetical protein n=1 Tax=uncultured Roseivirga sp. TaxID=543088 RepID=UPI0030DC9CFD|tara:strand:+ start:138661 stop:140865 length:2205 start_codon:yes stop_codon:yes gene_type:complete
MRRKLYILILLIFAWQSAQSQSDNVRENVLIHANGSHHLVGETIHYTLFCVSSKTGRISPLSKYAYIQIVGEEGVVYQKKHELSSGVASGEFFAASSLKTGQYYIVAYTRWMRNFEDYSKASLTIINPYQSYDNPKLDSINEPTIEFKPLGKMMVGVNNRIAFKLGSSVSHNENISVRLTGLEGEKSQSLAYDTNGIGNFDISPDTANNFRIVIDRADRGFEFIDTPNGSKNVANIHIEHLKESIKVNVNSPISGEFVIMHHDSIVYTRKIEKGNKEINVSRNQLPPSKLKAAIKDDAGRELAGYSLYNSQLISEETNQAFESRQLVSLSQFLETGVYSISVRKASSMGFDHHFVLPKIYNPNFSGATNFSYEYLENLNAIYNEDNKAPLRKEVSFLPEHKSELMTGRVTFLDGSVATQKPIILTLGESTFNIASSITDEYGRFLIEYETLSRGNFEAHVTVYDFENEYDIRIEDNFISDFPDLNFKPVFLDSSFVQEITDRAVQSQIENAFYLPSTYENNSRIIPVIENSDFTSSYSFDDYTRFKTIEEHFVEYIAFARVRKNRPNGFLVSTPYLELDFKYPALVVLDGIPVSGKALLEFSPYRIKKVDVFNSRFFLQGNFFDGVVNFTSIDGGLGGFANLDNTLQLQMEGASDSKTKSISKPLENINIPDQNIQLLWESPYRVVQEGTKEFSFFTSDLSGDFEMIIEGVTSKGSPISVIKKFNVKNPNNEKD